MAPTLAESLSDWMDANAARIVGRFTAERVGDWAKSEKQGVALDLWNDRVIGRIEVRPRHMASADWPFADAEILDTLTGRQLFVESFAEFGRDLLDRWLAALEAHSD